MAILGLTSLTGCTKIPDFIAAASVMVFQTSTAPTSWTKLTADNDKTLRVVSGTATPGGTIPFLSAYVNKVVSWSVNPATISTPQLPVHSHNVAPISPSFPQYLPMLNRPPVGGRTSQPGFPTTNRLSPSSISWPSNPGGGSHTHPISNSTVSLNIAYVDIIFASKD